ncbi:MAG: cyclic nucleotide-binding and patatin-like phospholipase domain-containing protein [Byssovorax sp.]
MEPGTSPPLRSDDRRSARALAALHATPALRDVSQRLLRKLLTLGQTRALDDHDVLCRETDPADAFFVVLDGRLAMRKGGDYIAPVPPGGSFGFEALLGGARFPATVTAAGPATIVRFPRDGVLKLLDDSAAFRQALRPLTEVALDDLETAEVVQLRSTFEGAPLHDLTLLLAFQVVRDFGDKVLILSPGEAVTSPEPGLFGAYFAKAPPGEVRAHVADFDYVFLDAFGEDLPAVQGRGDFTAVTLTRGAPPETTGGFPTRLYTVLVDERSPRGKPQLDGFRASGPPSLHRHAPCWVQLRIEALRGRGSERGGEHLDPVTRDSLGRWARALTQRRVGLTLSGGGAWGFIHLVLLEELHKRRVPVDIVTSASIGTMIGAFYAASGIDGARKLLELADRGLLDRTALKAIVNGDALRLFVEEHLGQRWLEHFTTRFHPVATDLNSAEGLALDEGPLGMAVRASCSAPGIWQPTVVGARHFVDGCVTHNTPSSILPSLGAHLVFASNCYPAAQRILSEVGQVASMGARALRMFGNYPPGSRLLDLMCAGDLMLHSSGELEAQGCDVYYSERPGESPLLGAARFAVARKMIEDRSMSGVAARVDAMQAKADEFARKWGKLKGRSQLRQPISLRASSRRG